MTQLPATTTGYQELPLNTILCGDNLDVMPGFPDESIDLVATDSPYGIGFMGKKWDTFRPQGAYEHKKGFTKLPRNSANGMLEFFVPIWQEVLRVLKPGAFAFVMCGPRQDCLARQILALEEAGFRIAYTSLYWTFASGFPKAQNVAKKIDTRRGLKGKVIGKKKIVDVQSYGAVGDLYQQVNKLPMKEVEITDYVSKEAQSLAGGYAGFQPKPAVEVILVAMKPLSEKTYVDQAMRNRKGITWLDEGRIPTKENLNGGMYSGEGKAKIVADHQWGFQKRDGQYVQPQGRFPANLICGSGIDVNLEALIEAKNRL